MTPLGRVLGPDERKSDHTGQSSRVQAGWGGGNLEPPNGEVCPAGDRRQSKGCMQD